jgi:hypothetical protein
MTDDVEKLILGQLSIIRDELALLLKRFAVDHARLENRLEKLENQLALEAHAELRH